MQILVHPMLQAQRAILDLPLARRREAILAMLSPFDPMMKAVVPPGMDPPTMFGLLRPDGPEAEYREALASLADAGAEEVCRQALERSVSAIRTAGYTPPIATIQSGLFLWEADPMMARLTQGYTGFGGIPGYIMVNLWPNAQNLPRLGACVAHEFNHQIRNSIEPWRMDISLAEYIVMEGLAESFAAELYGPDAVGPWVSGVTGEKLETARRTIGQALALRGFHEVRPYIFGDEIMAAQGGQPIGVPTYGGYAVGYHLVQAYMQKAGKTAAEATLVPSSEVVRVSGLF